MYWSNKIMWDENDAFNEFSLNFEFTKQRNRRSEKGLCDSQYVPVSVISFTKFSKKLGMSQLK